MSGANTIGKRANWYRELADPRVVATVLRPSRHPQAWSLGGAAAAGTAAHTSPVQRRVGRHNAAADAAVGALGGQTGYQLAGFGPSHYARHKVGWNTKLSAITDPAEKARHKREDKLRKESVAAHRDAATGKVDWTAHYRSFPLEHRYARTFRAIGHTHRGRVGVAIGATATAAGAIAGARHGHRVQVGKSEHWQRHDLQRSDYPEGTFAVHSATRRGTFWRKPLHAAAIGTAGTDAVWGDTTSVTSLVEGGGLTRRGKAAIATVPAMVGAGVVRGHRKRSRPAVTEVVGKASAYGERTHTRPVRTAELATGAAGVVWGAPRLQMLGPAIRRGTALAQRHGGADAARATMVAAEATRALLMTATAPLEQVRRLRRINRLVESIPAPLRPAVATTAGAILAVHAIPVRQRRLVPIEEH